MKHPIRRRLMFAGFVVLRLCVRWLPLPIARAVGAGLGYAVYLGLPRYRHLAHVHLHLAFGPGLSDMTCRHVSRRSFVNLGKNGMEWFVFDRLPAVALPRLVEANGVSRLRQALAKGQGVIALSAHFGNWELLAMGLSCLGFEGGVVARRLRYPEYEAFLWEMRRRKGVQTFARGDSFREIARELRANHIIGMMPDQDIDSLEGVFVDFFGRSAYTPIGPAALSLATGAPILPCFIVRIGRRFRIVIEEPIPVPSTGERGEDIRQMTQAWSRVVESYIRAHPDHWVWMHRRWKTAPPTVRQEDFALMAASQGGPL
ncbi:MAG: lysophospholipid acyltransferase family protein [Candidatus Omnitrophica bacterium]|nr:lysophospholipid acyltransferase family protein [Candidatus Omnitrophota bacterium]